MAPLISVQNLSVSFRAAAKTAKTIQALSNISFDIAPGEILTLLGESGCGKSLTSLALLQLLPFNAYYHQSSQIHYQGKNLLEYSPFEMKAIRGRKISIIFQEPMTSLNPVYTIGQQIMEILHPLTENSPKQRALEWLHQVGISEPERCFESYPHQLSGGQKQRAMIAMAMSSEPELLIADEPTTALDVTIQAQILDLLKSLQQKKSLSILLITHDLGVVYKMADRTAVMYAGEIVETADKETFFKQPIHPYSRQLLSCLPRPEKKDKSLISIPGNVPRLKQHWKGCRFAKRCFAVLPDCRTSPPPLLPFGISANHQVRCFRSHEVLHLENPHPMLSKGTVRIAETISEKPILEVNNLSVDFSRKTRFSNLLRRTPKTLNALDDVSFILYPGETIGIVGESGSGKSTTAKSIVQLVHTQQGQIYFKGHNILKMKNSALMAFRKNVQMIFQDPFSSMNPRMSVQAILMEGMKAHRLYKNDTAREKRVLSLLEQVGLPEGSHLRYPHQFSGGQRQRICIARALAVEPEILICDEPTSALDISVQAQIINLLKDLQKKLQLSYLFISHNISVIGYIADKVLVMYRGKIIESGLTQKILNQPEHPYTKELLSSVPWVPDNFD